MKKSYFIKAAFLIFCIYLLPANSFAQFENFAGQWKSAKHGYYEKQIDEDDNPTYTEIMDNDVTRNQRNIVIEIIRTDQAGLTSTRTFTLDCDLSGDVTGSGDMNSVKYNGTITGNNSEQTISITGVNEIGTNEYYNVEFVCQNSESGKVILMKYLVSGPEGYPADDLAYKNALNGVVIETRPIEGSENHVSYWQVVRFEPVEN